MNELYVTKLSDITEAYMNRLVGRRMPFLVSYHGSSTIIVDANGRWATGQVAVENAEQLAKSMADYVEKWRQNQGERFLTI